VHLPGPSSLALLGLLAVAGCAGGAAPPPSAEASRRSEEAAAFFSDPPLASPRLSPDGTRLVGVASRDGTRVLVEKPVRGEEVEFLGRFDMTQRWIHDLGWVGDGVVLLALEVPERTRGAVRPLEVLVFRPQPWRPARTDPPWLLPAPPDDTRSAILSWLPDDPEQLVVSWFEDKADGPTAKRVRAGTGSGVVVSPPETTASRWFVDGAGRVRAGLVADPEALGLAVHARADDAAPMEPLVGADLASETSLEFAGFDADPHSIFVYADSAAGRRGVYRYDLERGERGGAIVEDPRFDAGALVYGPASEALWAVEVEAERPERIFVADEAAREQASIDATLRGTRNRIVDADRSGAMALVETSADRSPPRIYLYDRTKREMELLYATLPALEDAELAPMRAVRYTARDGLEIPAYLTLPPGTDAASAPRLPAIVLVHDGPTRRVGWGWDARVQFLVRRGFAVLQPNFRGSFGYGVEFERAGYAAWGAAMQQDLADGAAWLVSEGIADAGRIGIFGAGYGGYAALMAPIATPGVFRAVAGWGAITDLVALFESPLPAVEPDPNHPVVWATPRDRARLESLSPLHRVADLDVPVLLGHGANDRRVSPSHSEALARALAAAGATLDARVYRGEGHDLRVESHRIDFHDALAAFFETHLATEASAAERADAGR